MGRWERWVLRFRELWEAATSVIIIEQLLNIKNYSIKQFFRRSFLHSRRRRRCSLSRAPDAVVELSSPPTHWRAFLCRSQRASTRHFHSTIGSCSLSSHPHSIAASTAADSARAFNTTILHSSTVCWCIESIKFVFIFASFFHFSRPIM